MGLWVVLAIVVFNVTFDWEVRSANHAFVSSQLVRQQQGQPPISINDGFRPVVRAAAGHSAVWLVSIAVAGIAATITAGRGHHVS
jgi:hypothetical protein